MFENVLIQKNCKMLFPETLIRKNQCNKKFTFPKISVCKGIIIKRLENMKLHDEVTIFFYKSH